MSIVETLNLISKTMDDLIDFAAKDEKIISDFEYYLEKNKIEVERQQEISAVLVEYILDGKMKDNLRVMDYFLQKNIERGAKNPDEEKILNAFKKSFVSVFKINKILKNGYLTTCLANEFDFELIPLVKMTNLRGVGLYDYIKARMIEIEGSFYLLEIFDCFGQFREYQANVETIKCLIKYPESQTMYNGEKLKELQKSVKLFNEKFISIFKKDEIIMSNSLADDFIKEFNVYVEGGVGIDFSKYEEKNVPEEFFNLEDDYEEDFIKNASGGFKEAKMPYGIGFYSDSDLGLFIIPFLNCVNSILENGIKEDWQKACITSFLTSPKVSPNLLIKKGKEFKNFIKIINEVTGENFKDIREVISFFKPDWIVENKFSPTIVLYNSKVFEKLIGMGENEDNTKEEKAVVGRNEPCPCGSGKKYKNCCLK